MRTNTKHRKPEEWEIPMNLTEQERKDYKMTTEDQLNNTAIRVRPEPKRTTNKLFDQMTAAEIEMLVELGDADGVYTMLEDAGHMEAADYVYENYF